MTAAKSDFVIGLLSHKPDLIAEWKFDDERWQRDLIEDAMSPDFRILMRIDEEGGAVRSVDHDGGQQRSANGLGWQASASRGQKVSTGFSLSFDRNAEGKWVKTSQSGCAADQASQAPAGLPSDEAPSPVMSVPRFGGAPDQTAQAPAPSALPPGRAGPPGSVVASGQVGPTCMGELWPKGFHADRVECPIYLKTQPGLTEQCSAHAQDGSMANVTVTFLDYDPITRESKIDCSINP